MPPKHHAPKDKESQRITKKHKYIMDVPIDFSQEALHPSSVATVDALNHQNATYTASRLTHSNNIAATSSKLISQLHLIGMRIWWSLHQFASVLQDIISASILSRDKLAGVMKRIVGVSRLMKIEYSTPSLSYHNRESLRFVASLIGIEDSTEEKDELFVHKDPEPVPQLLRHNLKDNSSNKIRLKPQNSTGPIVQPPLATYDDLPTIEYIRSIQQCFDRKPPLDGIKKEFCLEQLINYWVLLLNSMIKRLQDAMTCPICGEEPRMAGEGRFGIMMGRKGDKLVSQHTMGTWVSEMFCTLIAQDFSNDDLEQEDPSIWIEIMTVRCQLIEDTFWKQELVAKGCPGARVNPPLADTRRNMAGDGF